MGNKEREGALWRPKPTFRACGSCGQIRPACAVRECPKRRGAPACIYCCRKCGAAVRESFCGALGCDSAKGGKK